ncbi:hypothetical protein OS493_015393 [Desmophyllum pertusum]|uniref:EGF-like domain-containing protein n=1 Tax=Desmophyllum pertusum TaxID=174260 RepID=A0A9W9Z0Q2_9CNID|nr:hypothetical protein OS493_015393 [Desmophyllum pertusum]
MYKLIFLNAGQDIDECLSSNGFCTHQCVNTAGSYRCECSTGFYLDSNGRSCSDYPDCLLSHGCQHTCNNFLGSFFCSCRSGYALNNDNRTCSDEDECTPVYVASLNKTVISAGCDQLCHNTLGNYTCSCNQGYQLLYDGKRCRDINECRTGAHSCEHNCHNTPGSYGCSCFHGYKLRADMRVCQGHPEAAAFTTIRLEGVSAISNIEYADEGLCVWKSYKIGRGKLIQWEKLNVQPNAEVSGLSAVDRGTNGENTHFKTIVRSKKPKIPPKQGNTTDPSDSPSFDESSSDESNVSLFPCPEEGSKRRLPDGTSGIDEEADNAERESTCTSRAHLSV